MKSLWRDDFPKDTNPLNFFIFCSRPHWRPALIAFIAVVVAGTFVSTTTYVFKLITDAGIAVAEGASYENLLWAAGIYILFLAAAKASWRISGFAGMRWATGARATARHTLTSYVTLHSRTYFSDRFAGSIANKISHASTGMLDTVEQILWQFMELFVSVIASFIISFLVSPSLAFIFLAWVFVVGILNVYFVRKRIPLSAYSQRVETRLTGMTVDLLSNITTMQEYARRKFEMQELKHAIHDRRKAGLRNWGYGEWVLVLNNILQFLFGGTMLLMAVYFMSKGMLSVGDIVLVIVIILRIEGQLQSLGGNINKMSNTWGEIEESLVEIIEPHEIADKENATELTVPAGAIQLNNVTFTRLQCPAAVPRGLQ